MLRWENKLESSIFLFAFVFAVWIFELWMIPLALTVLLTKEATSKAVSGNWETKIEELFHMPTEVNLQQYNTLIKIEINTRIKRKKKGELNTF